MATIRQNNIDFTNVSNEPIFMTSSKISISDNNDGTGKFDTDMAGDEIGKSFNAIEIDWNGATTTMGEEQKVINTTGELISYLATAYTNAFTAVNSSGGGVDVDTINDLINSYLNLIPITSLHRQLPSAPQENTVTLGGRGVNGNTSYQTTSQIYLNGFNNNNMGIPNGRNHVITFNCANNSTGTSTSECAYFDANGDFHMLNNSYANNSYATTEYANKLYLRLASDLGNAEYFNINDILLNLGGLMALENQSSSFSGNLIAYSVGEGFVKSKATIDNTGVFYTSDISLKENIEQIIDSEIDNLFDTESGNMYSFDWKDSHEHSFGFIAQEIEQFAPEAVHEFDGIKKVNYEVALTKVCAAMFKKIKQLEARIEELEK